VKNVEISVSVLDDIAMKLGLFLDEPWFTLSKNVNSQSSKYWCCKNPQAVNEAFYPAHCGALLGPWTCWGMRK